MAKVFVVDSDPALQVTLDESGRARKIAFAQDHCVTNEVQDFFVVPRPPIHVLKDDADLLSRFRSKAAPRKKEIPPDTRYVMEGLFHRNGKPFCKFFCLNSDREMAEFFASYAALQQAAKATPVFMMECTLPNTKKKWVIDIDGDMAKMHEIGFCKAADHATADELGAFEDAALQYTLLICRELFELGCIASTQVAFSVNTRHRFVSDGDGGGSERCCKASMHITIDAMATQQEWQGALLAVRGNFASARGMQARGVANVQHVLQMQKLDDETALRNSAGQPMSILCANKLGTGATSRQPMFSFFGFFIADITGMRTWRVQWKALDGDVLLQYFLTSMLLADPFTLGMQATPRTVEALKAKQRAGAPRGAAAAMFKNTNISALLCQNTQGTVLPLFVSRMIFRGEEPSGLNTTWEKLYDMPPPCLSPQDLVPGVSKCVKINRPPTCLRYVVQEKDKKIYGHKSNGCVVWTYSPAGGRQRVFVKCFGCLFDGRGKAPVLGARDIPSLWPWFEVFPRDVTTMQKISEEGGGFQIHPDDMGVQERHEYFESVRKKRKIENGEQEHSSIKHGL